MNKDIRIIQEYGIEKAIEVPFTYTDRRPEIFRIEAYPFSFRFNPQNDRYIIDFSLNTKASFELCLDALWNYKTVKESYFPYNDYAWKFLYDNSFAAFVCTDNFRFGQFKATNDYFPVSPDETLASSLFNVFTYLTELAIESKRMSNQAVRINRIDRKNFNNFISNFNAHWNTTYLNDTNGYIAGNKLPAITTQWLIR